MTTTQHTAGPWKVETWDYTHAAPPRQELNIQNNANLIATLQCDFTGDNPYTIPQDEAQANARLIAASPLMLEALKAAERVLVKLVESTDYQEEYKSRAYNSAYDIIQAAIQQAHSEGRP